MFEGFGPQTLEFLEDLEANNRKDWFDAHRAAYQAHYLAPAQRFVEAAGPALKAIAPGARAEPRVNGSIFRVNRDVRFSKDKTPYKPHIDLWFWEGERRAAVSGFFLRVAPRRIILGAGGHKFTPDQLKAFRDALEDPKSLASLTRASEEHQANGLPIRGSTLTRLPRGYEAIGEDHKRLLLHTAIWTDLEGPHPASIGSASFVDHCVEVWRRAAPLHRWLIDTLDR